MTRRSDKFDVFIEIEIANSVDLAELCKDITRGAAVRAAELDALTCHEDTGISYLNLGVKPPTPSWGNILYDGYTAIRTSSTLVIAAGAPLVLATLGFTFLGEGLRDALDPRFATARPR